MAQNPFEFLKQPPILVCGAGPTGLAAALWLQKCKIPFRIIDLALKPGTTSRATVVHARILEFYDQLGVVDQIIASGTLLNGMRIYSEGAIKGELRYKQAAVGQSKYPHILSIGQDKHEAVLNDICAERGIKIERGLKLTGAIESESIVECILENTENGQMESFKASYVIGADGAHSTARRLAGIGMTGGTYANRAYVADVQVDSAAYWDGNFMNANLGRHLFCLVIPQTKNRARIIGLVPADKVDENGDLKDVKELQFADIEYAIKASAPTVKIEGVEWFSTYRIHHRIANAFRSTFKASDGSSHPGRIFICGDAGHLHSPVGGQGMNTGIGDAINLSWKLAAVHSGTAPSALLETYATERRGFAEVLVSTTDTVFQYVNDQGWRGWIMRNIFMPYIFTSLFTYFKAIGTRIFRQASQIAISYPNSMLSTTGEKINGSVKAGERLPWVEIDGVEGEDNFYPLRTSSWQAHVYGSVDESMSQLLEDKAIPLHRFPYNSSGNLSRNMQLKGLGKDTLYLIRPDGQVGLVCANNDDQLLNRYIERWDVGLQVKQ